MSTIETPPLNRLPVETIVCGYDERIIRNAINREKPQIVWRELVFNARVTQPDNQFHALSVRS